MTVSQSGNSLTLYANSAFTGMVSLVFTKSESAPGFNNLLGLTGAAQTMLYGSVDDPGQVSTAVSAAPAVIQRGPSRRLHLAVHHD